MDIPFDRAAVEESVGEPYANALGRSDLPVFEQPATETLESYCRVGNNFCDVFKKLDATCKVGRKSGECPKKMAQDKKGRGKDKAFDGRELIGIDVPFNYEEVVSVTGPEYVTYLNRDGMSFVPFEELKKRLTSPEQEERAPQVDRPELPEAPVLHSILVIDDEPSVNNNIRKILLKKGYTVDQALTKQEALEQIERRAYKVILLDLKIPGVNGLELLAAIREKSPDSRVIIITGYATIETAKETARLGAVDYLAKPFTPEEIRISTENAFRYAA